MVTLITEIPDLTRKKVWLSVSHQWKKEYWKRHHIQDNYWITKISDFLNAKTGCESRLRCEESTPAVASSPRWQWKSNPTQSRFSNVTVKAERNRVTGASLAAQVRSKDGVIFISGVRVITSRELQVFFLRSGEVEINFALELIQVTSAVMPE